MALWVRVLATKFAYLRSMLRTHRVEGQNQFLKLFSYILPFHKEINRCNKKTIRKKSIFSFRVLSNWYYRLFNTGKKNPQKHSFTLNTLNQGLYSMHKSPRFYLHYWIQLGIMLHVCNPSTGSWSLEDSKFKVIFIYRRSSTLAWAIRKPFPIP